MSVSQYDDLLGEFGDSTSTSTKTNSNGAFDEDFDPFGPSPGAAHTTDAQIINGNASNGLDFDFGTTTSSESADQLHIMSSKSKSSEDQLYEHESGSANPLYDLSTEVDTTHSSSPAYEFSEETISSSKLSNQLCDFENDVPVEEAAEEEDLLSGFSEQQKDDSDLVQTSQHQFDDTDLLSDFEVLQKEDALGQQCQSETLSYQLEQLIAEPNEPEEDQADDAGQNYADNEEAVEEDDDGHTFSGTSGRDNRLSDSGLENKQISAEFASNQWAGNGIHQGSGTDKQSGIQNTTGLNPASYEIQASTGHDSQHYTAKQQQQQVEEEEEEEGVYENQPTQRGDVAREGDTDRSLDIIATGTAHNLREKFLIAQQEAAAPTRSKREITPPAHGAGGEYVSEPRGYIERYEGKADSGVFESQPVVKSDVITSNTPIEEARIESGFAKNTAAKFKELQNKTSSPSSKKELTPDPTGQVEYVSEPRGHVEHYEGKAESGVFESEPVVNPDVVRSGEEVKEELPERGTARHLADKFRQISSDTSSPSTGTRGKREITPDRSGRVEYVSEPRGQRADDYEVRVDAGVFENQPQRNADVITSDTVAEEVVPERGYAKNVAAKFKELETTVKSPPLSPGRRKEFTPPRDDDRFHQSGVVESTPDFKSDVIHSSDHLEEALPERGTAKNIAQRFRQLETESKTPGSFKAKKEFTPPPGDSGVFENQPKQFNADYNRPPESGIIENQPLRRDDVVRGDEPPKYEVELPERGAAKNLVNKWKQLESEGTKVKSPGTGRQKEFTPPREEPRIAEQRKSPRTPLSPSGNDQLDNGSVHPSDLPGQYQPLNEPTIFESSPQQRSDVLREVDTDWTEGMPKKDTAKKMLAKFQNIQAEANKQASGPVSRKDSTSSETQSDDMVDSARQKFQDKVGRSKSMRAAIQTEKCGACEKTVYAMERLEMNKRVYHKACFRCTHCKAVLTPKTFAINNEVIFCTTHYKQLFATKGNYDEGFGRLQHKKRWNSNPDLAKDAEENDMS